MIDVDDIFRALTRPCGGAIAANRSQFDAEAIAADGSLNRAGMRKRVFDGASAKQQRKAILHLMIGVAARAQAARSTRPDAMRVVPLVAERDAYHDVIHRVAIVDCPESL